MTTWLQNYPHLLERAYQIAAREELVAGIIEEAGLLSRRKVRAMTRREVGELEMLERRASALRVE